MLTESKAQAIESDKLGLLLFRLPANTVVRVNALGNLKIEDKSGRYIGYIDMEKAEIILISEDS